jgi:hypothetical protein
LLEPAPAFGSVGVFWMVTSKGKPNKDNPASTAARADSGSKRVLEVK